MRPHRITTHSSPGGWLKRQREAAEKREAIQAKLADPDYVAHQRELAEQREAQAMAERERAAAERAKTACPCCKLNAGTYSPGEVMVMTRKMLRELGRERIDTLLADEPAPVTTPELSSVSPDLAQIVENAVRQALAANAAILSPEDGESNDPNNDPVPVVPARRGPGRPPKPRPAA
ncbi:hypothetical protein [Methylobacterium sp. JK268]